MPHVPESRLELPEGRYGSPRKFPLWLALPLVAVGIGLTVFVVVAGARQIMPDTRANLIGFRILSDTEVSATVEIRKPRDATATCTLQARNFYSDAVGTAEIVIDERTDVTTVTRTFPTSEEAVTVEATGCTKSTEG